MEKSGGTLAHFIATSLFIAVSFSGATAFGQSVGTAQSNSAALSLPELMMAQLQNAASIAAADVLPVHTTITIGDTGIAFPPLSLPNPTDPSFLDGLQNAFSGMAAWNDWREDLSDLIEAGSGEADSVTAVFLASTDAAIAQAISSTEPNFDLLSIYHSTPTAAAQTSSKMSSNNGVGSGTGFFFQ